MISPRLAGATALILASVVIFLGIQDALSSWARIGGWLLLSPAVLPSSPAAARMC